jgi:hypothetical protein
MGCLIRILIYKNCARRLEHSGTGNRGNLSTKKINHYTFCVYHMIMNYSTFVAIHPMLRVLARAQTNSGRYAGGVPRNMRTVGPDTRRSVRGAGQKLIKGSRGVAPAVTRAGWFFDTPGK